MRESFLKQLSQWPDKIAVGMHFLAAMLMFILVFITTGDVVGRTIFNRPIPGIPEIIKLSLVFICFLLLPEATRNTRHIRTDILFNRLSPYWKGIMSFIRFLLGALLLIGIVIGTWDDMIAAWKSWEYEGEGIIRIPVAPLKTTILICSALAAFFCFRLLRRGLKSRLPRKD